MKPPLPFLNRCVAFGVAVAGPLVVHAGSVSPHGAGGIQSASDLSGDSRPAAEWLQIIGQQARTEKASWSHAWHDVMKGAALSMEPYDGRPEMVAKLTGEKQRLYDAWLAAWEEQVRAVADRLAAGEPISAAERPYRFLASGTLLHRYHRHGIKQKQKQERSLTKTEQRIANYAQAIEAAGKVTLAKGYRGEELSPADIDVLRDYALFIDIRCTGQGVLPCHLGLTRSRYGKGFRKEGEPAPDFVLARMETFLGSRNYTDLNPRDPVDILTSLAVKEFLLIMRGFHTRDGEIQALPYEITPGKEDSYVRLSDYRGRKPVLLVFMNATDPWAWHGRIAPMFEPLKQAIGDRMAVYFINTTIHDTRMPSMDFLGENPRRTAYVHETAMEHRARICKMFYLGWPDCTTDYLLDDLAQHFRNEWMDQGGGAYIVLIDPNGTISYADYHKEIPPHWGPNAVDFPYEFLTIRMNHLESRLASFFGHDQLYRPEIRTPLPPWRLPAQRDRSALADSVKTALWMPARVVSVDAERQEVIVERALPPVSKMKGLRFWDEAGDEARPFDPAVQVRLEALKTWLADTRETPTYVVTIDDHADIFVNGWSKPMTDLLPGDPVGVYFSANQTSSRTLHPLQLRVYRFD